VQSLIVKLYTFGNFLLKNLIHLDRSDLVQSFGLVGPALLTAVSLIRLDSFYAQALDQLPPTFQFNIQTMTDQASSSTLSFMPSTVSHGLNG
jgi:hypothetical protein